MLLASCQQQLQFCSCWNGSLRRGAGHSLNVDMAIYRYGYGSPGSDPYLNIDAKPYNDYIDDCLGIIYSKRSSPASTIVYQIRTFSNSFNCWLWNIMNISTTHHWPFFEPPFNHYEPFTAIPDKCFKIGIHGFMFHRLTLSHWPSSNRHRPTIVQAFNFWTLLTVTGRQSHS